MGFGSRKAATNNGVLVNKMNVVILNGSPRANGNVSKLLSVMREELENNGSEVHYITTNRLNVAACIGCMQCRSKLECVLPHDDAQDVLELIKACDCLIVGSPCYWGNIPGKLKMLFDRIVYGMMGESKAGMPKGLHKGKKAILVSTCTTPFPFNMFFNQSHGVVKALKEILKWSGFNIVATIERGGTKNKDLPEKSLDKARKAAHKIL